MIPIVTGVLGTIHKGLIKERENSEIREQVGAIQTTALLRSERIQRVLTVTRIPKGNYQLTLVWKILRAEITKGKAMFTFLFFSAANYQKFVIAIHIK